MSFFNKTPHNEPNPSNMQTLINNLKNGIKSENNFRAKYPICGCNSAIAFVLFENILNTINHFFSNKKGILLISKDDKS